MKKTIKIIRNVIIAVVLIVVIFFTTLIFHGYIEYRSFSSSAKITDLVVQVQSKNTYVSYEDLPKTLVRATVSIEDRRYFEHDGVDYKGLTRAVLSQFDTSFLRSGGSTITQQLAKNLYGEYNSSFNWKTAEFFFARELEQKYSKKQIFDLYVNVINYGNGYTGIYEASYGYFGVAPEDLTDAQCTILAGIPQSPSSYELTGDVNIQQAKNRQKFVLEAMVKSHYINQMEADRIYNTSIWQNSE